MSDSNTSEPATPLAVSRAVAKPAPGSGEMFDRIAQRYDLLNRILSLNVDQRWRRATIRALRLMPESKVLDLATGTADMALLIHQLHGNVTVTGVDPSRGMLDVGVRKVQDAGASARITLEQGDAQRLPFQAASFDACCIAFGIRNVPDRVAALREMNRVVRPGGRVCILELSEPRRGLIAFGARLYIHQLVPRIGAILSGKEEYRYLQTSVSAFPPPELFAQRMGEAGLRVLEVIPLMFGVCQLYVAEAALVRGTEADQ